MCKKSYGILIVLGTLSLGACSTYNPAGYTHYQRYWYEGSEVYPEGYDYNYNNQYGQMPRPKKQVVVPESYHVGSYHNPASHKDRDRSWAGRQHPANYTIELANGDKASSVARQLHRAPKSERRAQIKYHNGGRTQYKGVFGSYSSREAAEKAMQSLPDELKSSAQVKTWGNVQRSTGN